MHRRIIRLILTIILVIPLIAQAQQKGKKGKKVIVEYEKYQSFDLGSLQIEGRVLAPGDLTINNDANPGAEYPLYDRKHYRKKMIKDINSMR